MAQTEQIKALEKKIAEGLKPRCPICGSTLMIEGQEGSTGAKAYNYACTKENDPDCSLRPGTTYVPWHRVISHALQSKVVQFALLIIGSVSLTIGAGNSFGWLQFGENETSKEIVEDNSTDPENRDQGDNSALQAQLSSLTVENENLKSTLSDFRDSLSKMILSDENLRLITYGKIWAATEYPNQVSSIDYLFSALDDLSTPPPAINISFESTNEIIEKLGGFISQGRIKDPDPLQRFINYTRQFAKPARADHNLAIAYFHLADQGDEDSYWKHKLSAMQHFIAYLEILAKNNPNLLAQQKALVWPSIADIYQLARSNRKLPGGWKSKKIKTLEEAVDSRNYAELNITRQQLSDYIKTLE